MIVVSYERMSGDREQKKADKVTNHTMKARGKIYRLTRAKADSVITFLLVALMVTETF